MIFVDRNNVTTPDYLIDPSGRAFQERIDAIALFDTARDGEADINEKRKAFKFEAYNSPKVKKELRKLFADKCAYCESKFSHVYYGDIEHFRPKKGVGDNPKSLITPGYYWLASDWDNLLFSCLYCNQSKKQEMSDGKERSIGKQSQFPLSDQGKYARRRSHIEQANFEKDCQLLIDPCNDKPEEYFVYENNGVIKPKHSAGYERERADTSILVFALQRMPLVQRREEKIIEIYAQMQRVDEKLEEFKSVIKDMDIANQMRFNLIFKRELQILKDFCKPEKEFAGLAIYLIQEYLKLIGLKKE